jgi:hypothetical protein
VIVVSVLLVLVAGVLLGLGLVRFDAALLYSSIGVSALAALALVVGVRRLAAFRAGQGLITVRPAGASLRPSSRATTRPVGRATPRPVGRAVVDAATTEFVFVEPAEEVLAEGAAARVTALDAEVVVVDGRTRYHLETCPHLVGQDAEQIPIAEAVEIGFTPCDECRPASALLRVADGA